AVSRRAASSGFLRWSRLRQHVEERVLSRLRIALTRRRRGERLVDLCEERTAGFSGVIEGPGLDQMFENALVQRPRVDAGDEIVEVVERAAGLALRDDLLRGLFAHALDSGEAETNARRRLDVHTRVALPRLLRGR